MNSFADSNYIDETESNDTLASADVTYNDRNARGAISNASDVDWWTIDIKEEGVANFWIGDVPSGCNYRFKIYYSDSNGTTYLVTSNNVYNGQSLVKLHVTHGTYKIRIYTASGYSSSNYLFRVKNYTLPQLYVGDLLWNIESIYYYLEPSAVSMSNEIAAAANNWVNTGYGWNNLYPNTRTTNKEYSAMDIRTINIKDGYGGHTSFFIRSNGTSGEPIQVVAEGTRSDWLYCEIELNLYYLTTSELKQAVTAHEMGHVFGLDENAPNTKSIMYDSLNGWEVSTVQEVDHIAFNKKHP